MNRERRWHRSITGVIRRQGTSNILKWFSFLLKSNDLDDLPSYPLRFNDCNARYFYHQNDAD
ncbi:hypothetical protein T4B_837 [Trichinella pseudospiralis]|uniref:Uncharacterized protein n=1 Tax=Trichinella pseudospiralis TaxID=6337 RepID=A0A0V1IH69_TRIPS|nr:hypothetical protein T4B_837 [Trichinella pseudospiralis]KRZ42252.1 hypothetical protein T4C_2307 [Trichinella pseudospiralis]